NRILARRRRSTGWVLVVSPSASMNSSSDRSRAGEPGVPTTTSDRSSAHRRERPRCRPPLANIGSVYCEGCLPRPVESRPMLTSPDGEPSTPLVRRAGAWATHLFTASGAVWAFLALVAVHRHAFREAFAWLAVAVVVDGLDGALARRLEVRRVLSEIDGELLDNIVDYATYVLVP